MENKNFSFQSKLKNIYYLTSKIPQILLIHPVLKFFIEMEEKGVQVSEWIKEFSDGEITINGKIKAKKEELYYYFNYYKFLKDNLYFGKGIQDKLIKEKYTAEMIKYNFVSCEHILFEVTDACQLKCKYCGYGDLYVGYDKRTSKNLSINTAKKLLDYYHDLRDSELNHKINKKTCIGFYGGEPLLNFPFINEMVNYAKSKKWKHSETKFSMTTNGVLLDRHMDFLVKNKFLLLISLDGNEVHNGYRVFKNGRPSFKTVFRNIVKLKEKYPRYFERNTGFISVNHKKNSWKEVENFFKQTFNRTPVFDDLNMVGVNHDKMNEFYKIYKQKYSDLKPVEINEYKTDPRKMAGNPFRLYIKRLINLHTNYCVSKYSQLFRSDEKTSVSGTCAPFSIRIFLTVNGKLLPCERIPQKYFLAEVDENGVRIDFQKVADKYNNWFEIINKQCNICYNRHHCSQCIFHLDLEDPSCKCGRYKNFDSYKKDLEKDLSIVEEAPLLYSNILNEAKFEERKYNEREKNK